MSITSQQAIEEILDIKKGSQTEARAMARELVLTHFPYEQNAVRPHVSAFAKRLESSLKRLGVTFIPYEEALVQTPRLWTLKVYVRAVLNTCIGYFYVLRGVRDTKPRFDLRLARYLKLGKRVRKGVSVIALGENKSGNLPMDYTMSFRSTSVITILDMPPNIRTETEFHEHFDTAMQLFTYHMSNIVIIVGKDTWILYNFNASHPTYSLSVSDNVFDAYVLDSFIPKVAAPIVPPRRQDFILTQNAFDPYDDIHRPYVEDLVKSGALLEKSGLYPKGKSIDEMSFRNTYYKWIGKLHLDHRNGMSYGFLARQMPSAIAPLHTLEELVKITGLSRESVGAHDVLHHREKLYLKIPVGDTDERYIPIPDVWVLTQRSGANKTNIHPYKDLIKMGLVNGKLHMETPRGLFIDDSYKPSFDTKVILAHALANAIIASILAYKKPTAHFIDRFSQHGMAIAHWHGYLNKKHIPRGWYVHGATNPHVSCSSPQSAIYAFRGKMEVFFGALKRNEDYSGDIHLEPHHGTNISYWSLSELGEFFQQANDISTLGNKYLFDYRPNATEHAA